MVGGKIEPCDFSDCDAHREVTSIYVIWAVDADDSHLQTTFFEVSSVFLSNPHARMSLERMQNSVVP
jgi:hypothetical protein